MVKRKNQPTPSAFQTLRHGVSSDESVTVPRSNVDSIHPRSSQRVSYASALPTQQPHNCTSSKLDFKWNLFDELNNELSFLSNSTSVPTPERQDTPRFDRQYNISTLPRTHSAEYPSGISSMSVPTSALVNCPRQHQHNKSSTPIIDHQACRRGLDKLLRHEHNPPPFCPPPRTTSAHTHEHTARVLKTTVLPGSTRRSRQGLHHGALSARSASPKGSAGRRRVFGALTMGS